MLEQLAAYIPIDRRLAMTGGRPLPEKSRGAVLTADISGFTPLTAALAQSLGPKRGAEELARLLNNVYDQIIAEVHRYAGSVIGFSGDAISCWFDDEAAADSGTARAVTSGLAIQEAIKQFSQVKTPAGDTFSIAIKVAISAGPARRFVVGAPEILVYDVMAGQPVDNVALVERLTQMGEVLIDAHAAALLGDRVVLTEQRYDAGRQDPFHLVQEMREPAAAAPWPTVLAEALSEDQARPWILPPVLKRLRAGQASFLSELRPAVALFLNFSGLDYEQDEAVSQKLDAYIRWAQNVLARYEGYLLQLTIGDKGSYLYAAFGAPLAHDDDPARAAAAALTLRQIPPALSFIASVSIGLSQGRMRAGPYGSPTRRSYGAIGEETNMAARLMSQAGPGQILLRETVASIIEEHFQLRSLGEISLKGAKAPVKVYELLAERRPALHKPEILFHHPIFGREEELAQLTRCLDRSAAGRGCVVKVVGDAGIGKSHLAAEAAARAQDKMRLLSGSCQSVNQGMAYAPWQPIFRALLGWQEPPWSDSPAALQEQQTAPLLAQLEKEYPQWAVRLPLLGDLTGLPIAGNRTTAALEPKMRQEALFALAVDMIRHWAAAQPLCIFLDDIHWMDEASLNLTLALARAAGQTPLCLLLAHRPLADDEQAVFAELEKLPHQTTYHLSELPDAAVAQLIHNYLQGEATPLLAALVQNRAQGNPFYAEELLDNLRESGAIVQVERQWRLAEPIIQLLRRADCVTRRNGEWVLANDAPLSAVDMGIPDSVYATILSRIDRLDEQYKLTMKVASVIGRLFNFRLLRQTHPTAPPDDQLAQELAEMQQRDFIRRQTAPAARPDEETTYFFKHNTVQEVVYDTLLFAQQRALHQAVSEALEKINPEEITQLAYHSYAGEDWPHALRYQILAGRRARQLFANREGIDYFRKALHCAEQLPAQETVLERQEIQLTLGELLATTGRYETAQQHLAEALSLAQASGAWEAEARACRWMARAYELQGQYPPALEWIQKGLLALDSEETAETAELLFIAGLINIRQGEYESAQELTKLGQQIAAQLDDASTLARAYSLQGLLARQRGNNTQAVEHFQQTLALYQEAANLSGMALAQNQLATAYFDAGQLDDAGLYYRQARAIFRDMGDAYNQALADNNLGGIALKQEKVDEALSFYQKALQAMEQIGGSLWVLGALHMNLGHAFLRRQDLERAGRHLQTSQDYYRQAQARDFLPELHRLLAETALAGHDLDEAAKQAQQSLQLARELGMRGEEGTTLRVLGETALARGEIEPAANYLSQSLDMLEEVADEYEWAATLLSLARLQWRQGERESARQSAAGCLPIFERMGATVKAKAAKDLL